MLYIYKSTLYVGTSTSLISLSGNVLDTQVTDDGCFGCEFCNLVEYIKSAIKTLEKKYSHDENLSKNESLNVIVDHYSSYITSTY